jgi:hypothetical protein
VQGVYSRAPLIACVALLAALVVAGCGAPAHPASSQRHRLLLAKEVAPALTAHPSFFYIPISPFLSADQQWKYRVDVAGDPALQAVGLAPKEVFREQQPKWFVKFDGTPYGRTTRGVCVGEEELAVLPTGVLTYPNPCERSGIQLFKAQLSTGATGAWLFVGDRNAQRPQVAQYVDDIFGSAASSVRNAGLTPRTTAQLAADQKRFTAWVAASRRHGVVPVVG